MSARAVTFVERWIEEHIQPDAYLSDDGGDDRHHRHAEQLLIDARAAGIPAQEILEEYPDLAGGIAEAMETVTDAEVRRLADKDD